MGQYENTFLSHCMTCVSPLILSDMELFVNGVQLQQVSQFLPVELHVRDSHCGVHTVTVVPLLLQQQEHILGHTVDYPSLYI